MARRTAAVAIMGAGLLLVGGAASYAFKQRDTEDTAAITAPAAAHAAWPFGERRNYAVTLKSVVTMDGQELLHVTIEGELAATRVDQSMLQLSLQLDPRKIDISGSPEEQASFAAALREPCGATFGSGGLADKIGFPELVQPEPSRAVARGLFRTMVSALQVAAPPASGAAEWAVEERDGVGWATVRYQRQGSRLSKTKSGYLRVTSSNPLVDARTDVVSSVAELALRAEPPSIAALDRVRLEESTRVQSAGPLPKLSSELELDIRLVGSGRAASDEVSRLARAFEGYRHTALDDRSVENQMTLDHAKLKGPSFAELLRALADLPAADARQRARLFALLKNRLRFDDGNVRESERLIRDGSASKATLIDALGAAGSRPAQAVLHRIVREPVFPDADRRRALISLSFVERASDETLALLHELRDDPTYGRQALYGLGMAAYNLKSSEDQTARQVTASLAKALDEENDEGRQITLIKALGNAGSPETLDTLEEKLKDPDPTVRAAAVWALRRVPGDRADQDIALTLSRDPASTVRLHALEAIAYRNASAVLVYAVRDSLLNEKQAEVRRELVRAALRWARAAPILKPVLSQLARSDPDQKVRDLLRDWV